MTHLKTEAERPNRNSTNRTDDVPRGLLLLIALLMAATFFRTQTVFFLPELEMFGGQAPDGWLAPWVSDSIIGLLLPIELYLFWKKRGIRVWGVVTVYNAVGAFDYVNGLAAQWVSPMPTAMASSMTVYAGIGVFLVLQLTVVGLMFQPSVVQYFALKDRSI